MLSQPMSVSFDLGDDRQVTIETGKIARQADGAVTVRQGNCIVLATVVANKEAREGQDFFPPFCRLPRKICFSWPYSRFVF